MADQFKSFDTAPIIGVVNIKHWSFALREIILAAVSLLLLVMCLIFVGLYANSKSEIAGAEQVLSPEAIVQKGFCVTKECMDIGARAVTLMNTSVDPCENFYDYACGNYAKFNAFGRQGERTVVSDMRSENINNVITIILSPAQRYNDWSYERKLSHYYQACSNLYTREKLLGRPFLEKVVPELGGWDILGNWDETAWDLNTMLKKVQSEFWVDAFYTPYIEFDPDDWSRRILSLSPAGTGKYMYWSWYLVQDPRHEKVRTDYRTFMRRVASLLMRDAKLVNVTEADKTTRLDQFVNDTFAIETKIAQMAQGADYQHDPFEKENRLSLSDFTDHTEHVINYVTQLSYLFNEGHVTPTTEVVLLRENYFCDLSDMITSLPDADRKRMLHHYLIWRVAEAYVQDLSWEYIHANREIYEDTRGSTTFSGVPNYCVHSVEHHMRDALGALYVQKHFADESKEKATDITENLKKALQSQLDKTPWMDTATKDYAKKKLDAVTFKMGFPDWMRNADYLDSMYSSLAVNVSDYFGNLLSANQFKRKKWNRELEMGDNRRDWRYAPYDTTANALLYWNEIIAPAGLLRDPIFNHKAPHYATFGSLGVRLATFLHHTVDEWGMLYDTRGDWLKTPWWSNKTLGNYKPVHQCVVKAYTNITQDFVFGADQPIWKIPINPVRHSRTAIATTNGIRLALIGYNDWMATNGGAEKLLPGVNLTPQQMIFFSYAQSQCFNRDDFRQLMMIFRGFVQEDIQLNMAMGELQEFSDAFQCKAGATMNHQKKCDYY